MDSGEVLDLALRLYQSIGLVMLKATALPSVFCFAAIAFITEFSIPMLFFTRTPGSTSGQIGEALATLGIGVAVGGPLFLIGIAYAAGVIVHLVSDYIGGRSPSEASAHRGARQRLGSLLLFNARDLIQAWSGMLLGFGGLVAGAVLADLLPGNDMWPALATLVAVFAFVAALFIMPWILARHALAPAVICLEGQRPGPAIRRSIDLMRGMGWAPSGYFTIVLLYCVELLLLLLIWIGAGASLGLVQSILDAQAMQSWPVIGVVLVKMLELAPLFVAIWTVIPVWFTTTTLLYFERRIRLEGYDIQLLAQEVWRSDRQSRFEL